MQERSISGQLQIKRKDDWVSRFVQVDCRSRVLAYKNNRNDKQYKYFMDLLNCSFMKGNRQNDKEPFILVSNYEQRRH